MEEYPEIMDVLFVQCIGMNLVRLGALSKIVSSGGVRD